MTNTTVAAPSDGHQRALQSESGWFARIRAHFGFEEPGSIRGQLEDALKGADVGEPTFSAPERTMLLNILRFGTLRVEDVMVPRADIVALDEQSSLEELLRLFAEAGHSRIPIYRKTLDDPVGMVHIKDLMRWIMTRSSDEHSSTLVSQSPQTSNGASTHAGKSAQDGKSAIGSINLKAVDLCSSVAKAGLQHEVLFVPPSMPVIDLLLRMQSTHMHLALVVDEYGGTDGLVSIEDLVEEIVGDIEDEHDVSDEPLLIEHPSRGLIADARTPIEELEECLGFALNLPDRDDDDVDTLGGLVFSMAGRVPVRGELVRHPAGIEFEVLDADPRRIKKLKIHSESPKKSPSKAKEVLP